MKAVAWWKYNPLLEKPTHLEPVYPGSLYYYYGPDPAAGVSYGKYEDKENKVTFIMQEQDKEPLSPFSGSPMEKTESMTREQAEAFVSNLTILHGYDKEEKAEGMHVWKAEQAVGDLEKENKTMGNAKDLEGYKKLKAKIKAKMVLADDEIVDAPADDAPAGDDLVDDSGSDENSADEVSLDDSAPSDSPDVSETPVEDDEETIELDLIMDVINGQDSVESKVEAVKKVLKDTFGATASNGEEELIDLENVLKTIRSKAMANVKDRQKKTVKEKIIAKARKRKIIASLRAKKEEAEKAEAKTETAVEPTKEQAVAKREEIKNKIEERKKAQVEAEAKKQKLEDFKAKIKAKKEAEKAEAEKAKAEAEEAKAEEAKTEAEVEAEKAEAEAKKAERLEKIKAIIAKKKAEKDDKNRIPNTPGKKGTTIT